MKKLLLSLALVFSSSVAYSQVTLLDENFDSYTNFAITGFGQWQTLDLDGLTTYTGGLPTGAPVWTNAGAPQAFMIFNPTAAGVTNNPTSTVTEPEVRNFDPHSGTKYAASWGAVPSTTGGATANSDWLISPPVNLGLTGNTLTFWVKALSNTYGPERYRVGVYVGSGTPTSTANFTIISGATALSATFPNWVQQTFALNAYAGQTVRIGIQCVSADVYMFMVDDVKITALTLGTNETEKANFTISPNPTSDFLNIKSTEKIKSISVFDMSGRNVSVKTVQNVVNVKNLEKGTYIVSIVTDGGVRTEKFIKK